MQRRFGTSIVATVGLAVLGAAVTPAAAQGVRQSARPSTRPQTPNRPGVIPPGSSVLVPLPPYDVRSHAEELVLRDFMWMRSTAKDPDKFLYGRYNPRYQVVTPQPIGGPVIQPYPYPNYYYGPQVFPNPYFFGPYNQFGFGLGNGYQQQREVIIIRDGSGNGNQVPPQQLQQQPQQQAPVRPQNQPDRQPAARTEALKEDFYLGAGGRTEALPDALDDVRKAWLNGDFERLRMRFKADGAVRIFPAGKFKYSVASGEFLGVVKDAMTRIDTVAFELERPRSDEAGRVFVAGKHTFLDSEKKRQETYVSYTLQRVDGKWLITEAGSSSSPIAKHEE